MHSYQHNIKTFNNATRHLTRVERSLYRDLIELYYDSEKPLPADNFERLARLALANTDDEKAALRYVLGEFFIESNGFYVHDYCDEQIEKFYSNTTAKALAGKASAKARLEKNEQRKRAREKQNSTPVQQTLTDAERIPTNNEPLTSNHEQVKDITPTAEQGKPAKKTPKAKTEIDYSVWPQQPDQQILTDWIAHRKSKRAAVSQTVVDACGDEFRKAATFGYSVNDCLKSWLVGGWQGFKFEWMQNQLSRGNQNAGQPKSPIERFMREHYPNGGAGPAHDHGPVGRNDGAFRGAMDSELRGEAGRIGPMDQDLIGDFSRTDS